MAKRWRRGCAILVLLLQGCGRLSFDARLATDAPSADHADEPIDAPGACDPLAPFASLVRLTELMSAADDGGLRLTDDELVAYFHTKRNGDIFEIMIATRAARAVPFDPPVVILSPGFLWPSPSSDHLTLVYGRNDANLYATTRASTADSFVPGSALGALNTAETEASPQLGPLGTTLYFTRYGGASPSLQIAAWPSLSPTRALAELAVGATPNQAPVLSPDERVIYYSGGSANHDVYMATRVDSSQPFGAPVRVPELSTAARESPTWISPDLCRLYLEVEVGANDFDLFVAERSP